MDSIIQSFICNNHPGQKRQLLILGFLVSKTKNFVLFLGLWVCLLLYVYMYMTVACYAAQEAKKRACSSPLSVSIGHLVFPTLCISCHTCKHCVTTTHLGFTVNTKCHLYGGFDVNKDQVCQNVKIYT